MYRAAGDDAMLDAITNNTGVALSRDPALVALLQDIVAIGDAPAPHPSVALAQILTGDVALPLVEPEAAATGRLRRIIGRVAGAGVAAKVSLVAAAAGAAITTAGVTHALPDTAQRYFENVVNHATPWTITHHHAPPSNTPAPGVSSTQTPGAPTVTQTTRGSSGTVPPLPASTPPPLPVPTGSPSTTPKQPSLPVPTSRRPQPPSSHAPTSQPPAPPTSTSPPSVSPHHR